MTQPIHIALTFDDSYWAPAYAMMRAISLYTRRRSDLVFHLFERGLTEEHRADLLAITGEFPVALRWYDLGGSAMFEDIAQRMPRNERLSNIVYARLMIDRLIAPDVERILYLDCDMLVRDDIAKIYDVDLGNNAIAAVREPIAATITSGRDVRDKRDLFDVADPYFNAGLVLIDVAKWREAEILGRMEEFYRTGVMQRLYFDQDLLNLIFCNRWLQLPWRWNTIHARPWHESIDPAILHYTGDSKPWAVFAEMRNSVAFPRFYRHIMTNELFRRYAFFRIRRGLLKRLRFWR